MSVKEIFDTMEYGPAPEDAKLAQQWISDHKRTFGIYVGGKFAPCKATFPVFDPSSGKELAQIGQATAEQVNEAVTAARKALPKWQASSAFDRAKVLYALARAIQKHSRLFAVLESLDNGKPIRETRDIDIPLVARHFYHHAGWAQIRDEEFPQYEPVGVCGQIIPWNFPLLMLSWKIAPALAMGNVVILKPAEFTSLTALLFAEICIEAQVPPGVINIITGDAETGKAIVNHPDIDKIAFTGSTEVGRILRQATAGTGKKLSLELGGKSPFVVMDDADLDSAVEGLVDAIWFNQGQVCCAGSRLLVQEGVADTVIRKTKERMQNLRVGNPLDKAVDIGAIVAPVQLERIEELVKLGQSEGAELFQPSWACPKEGWFYPPTLLTNVGPASSVAQIEIFGPVLVAMTFRTPAEAIALANNTPYGLAASVWSENIGAATEIAAGIKAGTVWVNCTNRFDAACGFGGYRESGYGREGGREGCFEYLRPKGLHTKTPVKSTQSKASPSVDRTHKLFIAGKQARPDGGYSFEAQGQQFARGNRKDVRNAIEASESAHLAWSTTAASVRAQILYYLGENLSASGMQAVDEAELNAAVERCFYYAARCDKNDGAVHPVPFRGFTYTLNEPIGSAAIICPDDCSLLALLSLALPLIAMGNCVTVVPSETNPLAAAELYRVLEASDIPAGVFNIITGYRSELTKTLAEHDSIQAIWHFGTLAEGKEVETWSAGNLKQTWCSLGKPVDWFAIPHPEFLRRSVQVKNIWVPYGA